MGSAQQNQRLGESGAAGRDPGEVDGGGAGGVAHPGVELDRVACSIRGGAVHDGGDALLERVDRGVGRLPGVGGALGVPRAEVRREVGVPEQQRALGHEQADRVLHRVDVADEVVLVHEVEERDDVVDAWTTA